MKALRRALEAQQGGLFRAALCGVPWPYLCPDRGHVKLFYTLAISAGHQAQHKPKSSILRISQRRVCKYLLIAQLTISKPLSPPLPSPPLPSIPSFLPSPLPSFPFLSFPFHFPSYHESGFFSGGMFRTCGPLLFRSRGYGLGLRMAQYADDCLTPAQAPPGKRVTHTLGYA